VSGLSDTFSYYKEKGGADKEEEIKKKILQP
jgi:hypothetical protein